jgi:Uri superfamily endonuclease
LAARLARHKAVSKKLRWHIDYFRQKASWAGAAVFPMDVGECRLAALAAAALDGRIAALRFGASDCRCPGHLIVTQMRPAAALEALCQMGGQPWAEAQGEVAASGW